MELNEKPIKEPYCLPPDDISATIVDIKLIILGQNVRHYRVKFDVGVVKVKVHILHL